MIHNIFDTALNHNKPTITKVYPLVKKSRYKCSLGDFSLVHYFKKNFTHQVSLDLHWQVVDTIVSWWLPFGRHFYVFADITSRYGGDTAAIVSTWQEAVSLSTASPARGCHALQPVIGWELSRTCTVTSWSRHNDRNMAILPIVGGHAYGRKFDIKMHCKHGERYVNVKRKAWRF